MKPNIKIDSVKPFVGSTQSKAMGQEWQYNQSGITYNQENYTYNGFFLSIFDAGITIKNYMPIVNIS